MAKINPPQPSHSWATARDNGPLTVNSLHPALLQEALDCRRPQGLSLEAHLYNSRGTSGWNPARF